LLCYTRKITAKNFLMVSQVSEAERFYPSMFRKDFNLDEKRRVSHD
jgi:hypothetical protein